MNIVAAILDVMRIWSLNATGDRKISFDAKIRGASIGHNVRIAKKCALRNAYIDDYTYLGEGCRLSQTKIGKFCSVAGQVSIAVGNHPLHYVSTSPATYTKDFALKNSLAADKLFGDEYFYTDDSQRYLCEVGNDVWLGMRATLVCSGHALKIGDGAVIAAGAVVVNDVPPYAIVGGCPQRLSAIDLMIQRLMH